MDPCDECAFDKAEGTAESAGQAIVLGARELASLLSTGAVASRPSPETWSALEYACHVRDVLIVQRERVLLARRTDSPSPPMMGRDERVDHDGYAEQDPTAVGRQLIDMAGLFSNVLSRLEVDDWERTVSYVGLQPPERSLRFVAVDTWHEVHHHLFDVRRQIDGV